MDRERSTISGRILRRIDVYWVPIALAVALGVAVAMYFLQPVSHGHSYHLALKVTLYMGAAWLFYRWLPHKVYESKWLGFVVIGVGVYFAIHRLLTINPDAEIIHVYRSLFETLDSGGNPYACSCIFHRAEFGVERFGNFNYPPMEIWPYWAVYQVAGTWNSALLTGCLLVLQLLVCLIMWRTFHWFSIKKLAIFFPILVFFELYTNSATAFLFVALIVWVIQSERAGPRKIYRYLFWGLFGFGLLTKFIILPIFAAYYWHKIELRRLKSWLRVSVDVSACLAVACLLMLPFGIDNILKETLFFNAHLETRGALTTFYPNVLSGLFSWIQQRELYPIAGVVVLFLAVVSAPFLRIHSALLAATIAFMFVSPTPEPQYIPIVLYLALAGTLAKIGDDANASGRPDLAGSPVEPLQASHVDGPS